MTSSRLEGRTSLACLVFALTFSHAMATTSLMILPAVAPLVALEYGVDPSLVGFHISIVSVGLVVSLMAVGNLSRKLGGCRTAQVGHCLVALGMLLTVLPSIGFLMPGSLVIGLGFGLLAPAASSLLARFSPPARRNLVFSIQQTSVPLGGVFAALAAPVVAVSFGWRWAFILAILLVAAAIAALQTGRARWDDDRDSARSVLARNPFAGVRSNWIDRRLRRLSLAGMGFCAAQFCVSAFTVVVCVAVLDMSLVAAGLVMMVVQLGNTAGRMGAGWVADRIGSAACVLRWMAWGMLAFSFGFVWLSPDWPSILVYAMFVGLGATSGAWAGILMAEAGHLAGPGRIAEVVSATLVYVNIGKFIGPAMFAITYGLTQSYSVAFALLGLSALLVVYWLRPRGRLAAQPTGD